MRQQTMSKSRPIRLVKIAPGEARDDCWQECVEGRYICVGWNEVGDLRKFDSFQEFQVAFSKKCGQYHNHWQPTITKKAKELWTLMELEPGDKVIANKGTREVRAIGTVQDPVYEWRPEARLRHTVNVEWDSSYARRIPKQHWYDTVEPVSAGLYKMITGSSLPERFHVITPRDLEEERKRVERSVPDRPGQHRFRTELIKVYGSRCAISGCEVDDALEAAHIHPHTGPNSDDLGNGIVLRADLHRLFDRNLIGINPHNLKVVVRRSMKNTEYWRFNDRDLKLAEHARSRLSFPMLDFKWREYKAA